MVNYSQQLSVVKCAWTMPNVRSGRGKLDSEERQKEKKKRKKDTLLEKISEYQPVGSVHTETDSLLFYLSNLLVITVDYRRIKPLTHREMH